MRGRSLLTTRMKTSRREPTLRCCGRSTLSLRSLFRPPLKGDIDSPTNQNLVPLAEISSADGMSKCREAEVIAAWLIRNAVVFPRFITTHPG